MQRIKHALRTYDYIKLWRRDPSALCQNYPEAFKFVLAINAELIKRNGN